MPSIGQILSVSFHPAKIQINNNRPFHSRQLMEFLREGRIPLYNTPSYTVQFK